MVKVSKSAPYYRKNIWKRDGEMWFVDPEHLKVALEATSNSEQVIRSKMGEGYRYISELLAGRRVDRAAIVRVEMGLDDQPSRPHMPFFELNFQVIDFEDIEVHTEPQSRAS